MKRIPAIGWWLLLPVLLAPWAKGETFRPDINPALLYYQAFLLKPELNAADHDYLVTNQWNGWRVPDRLGVLLTNYEDELRLVHQAAEQKVVCDWGVGRFSPCGKWIRPPSLRYGATSPPSSRPSPPPSLALPPSLKPWRTRRRDKPGRRGTVRPPRVLSTVAVVARSRELVYLKKSQAGSGRSLRSKRSSATTPGSGVVSSQPQRWTG